MYARARNGIGYLAQENSIFRKLSVGDNIRLIWEQNGVPHDEREQRLPALLEEFGLRAFIDARGDSLSGGERRRVEIARALAMQPAFLLLDEPFTGIDPIAVADIQAMIRQLRDRGLGILITDHQVRETLAIVDRAYILNNGRIEVSGTAQEVLDSPIARQVLPRRGLPIISRRRRASAMRHRLRVYDSRPYMSTELAGPFVFGLSAFMLIFAATEILNIGKLVSNEHAPLWAALLVFAWSLPADIVLVIPMALLLGTLLAIQRLSGESEITAMKAAGITFARIVTPLLAVGIVLSFVTLYLQEGVVPMPTISSRRSRTTSSITSAPSAGT